MTRALHINIFYSISDREVSENYLDWLMMLFAKETTFIHRVLL